MFPLPDTAQLYYFPKSGDTKTAERTRRHLYRSYDLDMAKIRKFFESANFSAFFFLESAGEGVEVALLVHPLLEGERPPSRADGCCLHITRLFNHTRNCRGRDTEKRLHIPLVK